MGIDERRYNIIYADPPWKFNVWSKKGQGRSAEGHYVTQSDEFLHQLQIPKICDKNCVLLMWATFPCLKSAIELGERWGFIYKTVAFTWIKKNMRNDGIFAGMGYYTRANAEIVLLFTKGKPLARMSKSVQQVVITNRTRHSEKPQEVRNRIVELFGELPRIELFARDSTDPAKANIFLGWDVFGNEARNSIQLPE